MFGIDKLQYKIELLEQIGALRVSLIQIGIEFGLTNEKTIDISQKLDIYLAKYQSL